MATPAGSMFKAFINGDGNVILRQKGVNRRSARVKEASAALTTARLASKCKNENKVLAKKDFVACLKKEAVNAGLTGRGKYGAQYDAAGRLIKTA